MYKLYVLMDGRYQIRAESDNYVYLDSLAKMHRLFGRSAYVGSV